MIGDPKSKESSRGVYREIVEILELERSLARAATNEQRFLILREIVIRLLVQIPSIAEPAGAKHAEWLTDMAEVGKIEKQIWELDAPVPPTPFLKPFTGKDQDGVYLVQFHGHQAVAYLRSADLAAGLPLLMNLVKEKSYHKASSPLIRHRIVLQRIFARYGKWSLASEQATVMGEYTEADAERAIAATADTGASSDSDAGDDDGDEGEEGGEETDVSDLS